MAAGNALFVYSVPETPWHVVVTDQSRHFYFNSATKASVWQITETDEGVLEKIDYNQLAVLFAKSRGWAPREKGRPRKEVKKAENEEIVEEVEEKVEEMENPESEEEEEHVEPEVPHDLIGSIVADAGPVEEEEEEKETKEQAGGLGILQGYGSDSEEEAESPKEVNDPEEADQANDVAESEEDVNAGLELGILEDEGEDDSEEDSKSAFKELLSQHQGTFSKFDPWFLVAEELVSVLAQEPAFYTLLDETKEAIFNEWVAEQGESRSGIYPTQVLHFFQSLQEHKSEIRKLPYVQFKDQFPIDSEVEDQDKLYRQFRATLVEFAEYEKQLKKSGYKGENLKVKRVAEFVAAELKGLEIAHQEHELQADLFFEKWLDLCNHFDLPQSMVESPMNFILGDEKRYICYRDALRK